MPSRVFGPNVTPAPAVAAAQSNRGSIQLPVIHVTERQAWKSCRRYHKYSYRELLIPNGTRYGPQWFGTGVHYGLARYYRNQSDPMEKYIEWEKLVLPPWDQIQGTDRDQINEFRELAEFMLPAYLKWVKTPDRVTGIAPDDDFEVVAVEEPLFIRIPGTDVIVACTLDLLVRRKSRLWVLDHKTCQGFIDPEQLEWDDQMRVYLWGVCQKYGEKPAGAIYSQLRKKIPATPMLLKAGDRLSKDKSIDTTPELYREAVIQNGFNPDDYQDILAKIEGNAFFKREIVSINERELDYLTGQLQAEAKEMLDPGTVPYPNPTKDCLWACQYRNLCKAESSGGDTESLKKYMFHRATEDEWKTR